jgi:hypothetical protein
MWYINGKLLTTHYVILSETIHREDGPDIEYVYGELCWYLKGKELLNLKLKRLENL